MKLSIIVLSYNTAEITENCIKSVLKHTKKIDYELIVIDNASDDESVQKIKKLTKREPKLTLLVNKKNLGFTGGNNQGMKKAKGEYVLLLNSDTIVKDNAIGKMVEWMDAHSDVGISSCRLLNVDGTEQGAGGYFPTIARVGSWMTIQDIPGVDSIIKPFHPMKSKSPTKGDRFFAKSKELDWVTGAYFLIRKQVIEAVGYLDDKYFMYTEDVDYCYRAKKKGWKVWYVSDWSITHLGGASGSSEKIVLREFSGIKRFYKKHYPSWQYPILRFFLKLGSLLRMVIFRVTEGKESKITYEKAFKSA